MFIRRSSQALALSHWLSASDVLGLAVARGHGQSPLDEILAAGVLTKQLFCCVRARLVMRLASDAVQQHRSKLGGRGHVPKVTGEDQCVAGHRHRRVYEDERKHSSGSHRVRRSQHKRLQPNAQNHCLILRRVEPPPGLRTKTNTQEPL